MIPAWRNRRETPLIERRGHLGVESLVQALPEGAVVDSSHGCHTDPFFLSQEPPSLAFLARHLASSCQVPSTGSAHTARR